MIKAIIFDLDNTLLDFMSMKSSSINAAVNGMIEAGLELDSKKAKEKTIKENEMKEEHQSSSENIGDSWKEKDEEEKNNE